MSRLLQFGGMYIVIQNHFFLDIVIFEQIDSEVTVSNCLFHSFLLQTERMECSYLTWFHLQQGT